jgi:hypothetical protein
MDQVLVTIDAPLFITFPGVNYRPVGQHGPPLIGKVEDISMAFSALVVFKGGIGLLTVLLVIIFVLHEVHDNIFDTVCCFGIKKIESVVRGGKVAVHAVRDKTLGIVYMC